MPQSLKHRARQWAAACGAAALVALPLPALAQDAAAPAAADTTTAPPPQQCAPGAFGEYVSLMPEDAETDVVTAMHLEFQCGDILSDGTYIPTGYRVELEGECDGAPCDYPLAFVMATAHENRFEGLFVTHDGADVIMRLRKNRNGAMLVLVTQTPGSGEKPERMRIRMNES